MVNGSSKNPCSRVTSMKKPLLCSSRRCNNVP